MHKGVILLVKADDRGDALDKVNEFMEPYGEGDVWDWFSIGNRWHNTLAPTDKVKLFNEWMEKNYPVVFAPGGYSIKEVENDVDRPIIQQKWVELGLKSINPYYSSYGFDLPDRHGEGDDYNIVPLSECIDVVKEWVRDLEEVKEREFNEIVAAREKYKAEGGWDMSAYHANQYKNAVYNNFCFDSSVYDITESVGEKIPDNIDGYWAVMVDMHN